MQPTDLKRRGALRMAATATAGATVALAGCATAQTGSQAKRPMQFKDPIWNREMSARIEANADPKKFIYGMVTGVVTGVRPNERVRELMGFEVFSTIRVVRQPDGSYQRLCRELVFYRDLATGKLMDEWNNPYTNERVKVVDVANDPFNYVISDYYPDPPSYGGLNKEQRPPRKPFLRKWSVIDHNTIAVESDIHLYYPSAMQPEKWPRESPGKMTQVSEYFRHFIRREDLENPALDHIPAHGVWNRITPWLPWMLMDQAPGNIVYAGNMCSQDTMDYHPQDVLERVKSRYPLYLTAPETDVPPSLSSLERYAHDNQPAPRKR